MSAVQLRQVQMTLLKPVGGGDSRQVPVTDAALTITRRGASVTTAVTLYEGISTTVEVQNTGFIVEGDTVKIALANDDTYLVTALDSAAGTIDLYNDNAGSKSLSVGDRLLPQDSASLMYADPEAQVAISEAWPDEHGTVVFYPMPALCDAVLTKSGEPSSRLFINLEGGWIDGSADVVNASRYGTLQEALDACGPGARLYLPSGTYASPAGGLVVTDSIEIYGDGPNLTIIQQHPSSLGAVHPVIQLDSTAASISYVYVHDLALRNPSQAEARQEGAHGFSCITSAGRKVTEVRLSRVSAYTLDDDAFHFEGHDLGTGAVVFLQADCVEAVECHGSGFYIENSTAVQFLNCYAIGNDLFGAYCLSSHVSWYACAFENNCHYPEEAKARPSETGYAYSEEWGAQLRLKLCSIARVDACDFENFTYLGPPYVDDTPPRSSFVRLAPTALILEGRTGALVSNCTFFAPYYITDIEDADYEIAGTAIRISEYGWATVFPCLMQNVATTVQVEADAGPCSVHPQRISLSTGVGVNASQPVRAIGLAVPIHSSSRLMPAADAVDGQLVVDATNQRLLMSMNNVWVQVADLS